MEDTPIRKPFGYERVILSRSLRLAESTQIVATIAQGCDTLATRFVSVPPENSYHLKCNDLER